MKRKAGLFRELLMDFMFLGILYLFYHSVWVITLLLPCAVVYHRMRGKEQSRQQKELLGRQFRDLVNSLAASLRAGYSVENGLQECLQELNTVHGEDSPICREVKKMLNQISLGVPVEEAFTQFGVRSGQEDIVTFASVFRIVRKTGGNLVEILQLTAESIAGKIDTANEIAVVISARKLELKVISFIPAGIIFYINLTGNGLLDPLYGNLTGVLIMTICLGIYTGAVLLGLRMIRIDV